MDRQLKEFVAREYTEEDFQRTYSTPSHNIQSERVLGMSDAQSHRAPNARIDFVEAKVKAKTNKTLDWLRSQPSAQQDKLVRFSISKTRSLRMEKKADQAATLAEVISRMEADARKKEKKSRKDEEKGVKALVNEALSDSSIISWERVTSQLPTSEGINECTKDFILSLLNNPDGALGQKFLHTFYVEGTGNIVFCGEILKKKKPKASAPISFDIFYYEEGTSIQEGHQEAHSAEVLICDAVHEDLICL